VKKQHPERTGELHQSFLMASDFSVVGIGCLVQGIVGSVPQILLVEYQRVKTKRMYRWFSGS
jgi:hypothetical protein